MQEEANRSKAMNLIHYIIAKDNDNIIGATKLNKILWFSDLFHYLEHGKPITDIKYIKRQFGPAPEYQPLSNSLNKLKESGAVEVNFENFHGYTMSIFNSRRELSTDELSSIGDTGENVASDIFDYVSGKSARDISEISHNEIWEMANDGEEIPFCTIFTTRTGEITDDDRSWAIQKCA